MKFVHLIPVILLATALSACGQNTPPDYNILGELPSEIKVIQGTAVSVPKKILVRKAGNVPGTSTTIPAPANVTLGVGAMAPGITAAFQGAAAGTPPFDAQLLINVANTVPRGSYPVNITGTAPPVAAKTEATHNVRVYGPVDGGAYIEISPSEVDISPGGSATVIATVTRIPPYVGNVTVTYPGAGTALPTGVTIAGQTQYTFALGPPAGNSVIKQFILSAAENATGGTFPSAEVRTGPAAPGAKTDTAAHIVTVR